MIDEKLYLRKVTEDDVEILFEWVNDKEARQNAFDTHIITYEEHLGWFKKMMKDPAQLQYILMDTNTACGQIRLSIYGDKAEVDYSISTSVRGCGYGQEIIRLVIEKVKEDYPSVKKLIGKIKPTNVASFYCFEKNGFIEQYQQLEYDLTVEKTRAEKTSFYKDGGVEVLFLTNNHNTLKLFDWISWQCNSEICSDRLTVQYLKDIEPKLVISYNYNYLISKECIDCLEEKIINMHISLLPWNKGFSPNIWSFIDNTPKGVTIHMLSEGLDKGDILFQKEMSFDPAKETFETTYIKLNQMIVELFKNNWETIISGEYKKLRQSQVGTGSYHCIADLKELKDKVEFEWTDNIGEFLLKYNKCKDTMSLNLEQKN